MYMILMERFFIQTAQLFGYKETPFLNEVTGEVVYSYVQSQTAQDAVRILFCTLPIVIFVISIICAFKANMGKDRFNAIKEELAKRGDDCL